MLIAKINTIWFLLNLVYVYVYSENCFIVNYLDYINIHFIDDFILTAIDLNNPVVSFIIMSKSVMFLRKIESDTAIQSLWLVIGVVSELWLNYY